ncbi:MAG TPA: glycosyltransferase family 39 protein [Gemmataceae bacterium]|nr:glycosyltransferase family 39 protein [Gemmataceae bacterium]
MIVSRIAGELRRADSFIIGATLIGYAGLLIWLDLRNAPAVDEVGHLAAGVASWELGTFDLYPVNPPLLRIIASAPVKLCNPVADWKYYQEQREEVAKRIEWSVSLDFLRRNVDSAALYFALARWSCIPFAMMGAWFCWRWATELYGKCAGRIALILWCFTPDVLAWSATLCPDAAAGALGVTAGYFFWRWLKEPDCSGATLAGVFLGLAQLTKMTWVLLFGLWPLLWVGLICCHRSRKTNVPFRTQVMQLGWVVLAGIFVLNLGYAFDGTFTKLGHFTFTSHTLAGNDSILDGGRGGNQFAGTWLSDVCVPLPRDYVRGVDLQKLDFERGMQSYLLGQWSDRGWWYYYLVCAALKIPIGMWLLALLAIGIRLASLKTIVIGRTKDGISRSQNWVRANLPNELVLLSPGIVLFVFVSLQTGFSRHFRYVLPAYPFLVIWISSIAPAIGRLPWALGALARVSVIWIIASCLWIYPHSMSYFNEIVGGPTNGHFYLLDSTIDWGQDVFYLKRWCEKHPEARPLRVLFTNAFSGDLLNGTGEQRTVQLEPAKCAPMAGWYALSVHRIHDRTDDYSYFLRFKPFAMAGYSFYIYHISTSEANHVRRELGLADIPTGTISE